MSDAGSIGENASSAPVAPGGYARKATGLVRQVTGLDQFLFNAASTSPLGLAVVFGLFALVLFPRANPYVALIVALVIGVPGLDHVLADERRHPSHRRRLHVQLPRAPSDRGTREQPVRLHLHGDRDGSRGRGGSARRGFRRHSP